MSVRQPQLANVVVRVLLGYANVVARVVILPGYANVVLLCIKNIITKAFIQLNK